MAAGSNLIAEHILTASDNITIVTDSTTCWVSANTNAGAAGATYKSIAFDSSNLTSGGSGSMILSHSLSQQFPLFQLTNSAFELAFPDSVTFDSTSSCLMDLTNYGVITSTWTAVFVA